MISCTYLNPDLANDRTLITNCILALIARNSSHKEPKTNLGKELISKKLMQKHTTVGIRWWSPTQLLVYRSEACVWQSGRDAQFSSVCGRM